MKIQEALPLSLGGGRTSAVPICLQAGMPLFPALSPETCPLPARTACLHVNEREGGRPDPPTPGALGEEGSLVRSPMAPLLPLLSWLNYGSKGKKETRSWRWYVPGEGRGGRANVWKHTENLCLSEVMASKSSPLTSQLLREHRLGVGVRWGSEYLSADSNAIWAAVLCSVLASC